MLCGLNPLHRDTGDKLKPIFVVKQCGLIVRQSLKRSKCTFAFSHLADTFILSDLQIK